MLKSWFDVHEVKGVTVSYKPWRTVSVGEPASLTVALGEHRQAVVFLPDASERSWLRLLTQIWGVSLGLGKPFRSQNPMPSSSRAMVGLPSLPQSVTQERGNPRRSQKNTARPPSAWQNAQHAFLLTRERRQIFVGTRFRDSGIHWNWARRWILKGKEKLQALDRCPWLEQLSYIYTCMSIYTHMCLCICAYIYFIFYNL